MENPPPPENKGYSLVPFRAGQRLVLFVFDSAAESRWRRLRHERGTQRGQASRAQRSLLGWRKYLKFSPRKLRDTFIIRNAFLSDEMVSANKEVTWLRVSITLIYQLLSVEESSHLKKNKKRSPEWFSKTQQKYYIWVKGWKTDRWTVKSIAEKQVFLAGASTSIMSK